MTATRALIVCTNHAQYFSNTQKTGLWLSEATHFMDSLEKRKIICDLVSPKGGLIPVDERSMKLTDFTNKRYIEKATFTEKLKNSLRPENVDAAQYQIIYFAGGHGCMWDFPENAPLQNLTRQIYENDGMVAAVCHGLSGLLNVKLSDGSFLIAKKHLTGFSNLEERIVRLEKEVPFLLEDELVKRGAIYHKGLLPFARYIEVDERLITGQNPYSSRKVGRKVVEEMFEK